MTAKRKEGSAAPWVVTVPCYFFFFGPDLRGAGGAAHTRFRASLNSIGTLFSGVLVMYWDANNLDHDPALATAIGNMIVAWAQAESHLVNVFAYATNIHHNSATIIFSRIPTFESKVKVTRAALAEWETKKFDKAKIDSEVDGLNGLSGTRNKWVHGLWCWHKETKETVVFNFRAAEERGGRMLPVKAHDVQDHIRAVLARIRNLAGLLPYPYEPALEKP